MDLPLSMDILHHVLVLYCFEHAHGVQQSLQYPAILYTKLGQQQDTYVIHFMDIQNILFISFNVISGVSMECPVKQVTTYTYCDYIYVVNHGVFCLFMW